MRDAVTEPTSSRTRTVWRRVGRAFTAIALAAVCLLALLMVGIPFALGAQGYTVMTGSMRPGLQPGSLVAVRPVPMAEVRVGDVLTYQLRSGEPEVVTHRVVGERISGDGERLLLTRGDANDTPDAEPVQAVQVRGVVVYAIPLLGYINLWATPWTKSILVTVIGGGAILYGIVVLVRSGVRRGAPALLLPLIGAAIVGGALAPAPAHAATEVSGSVQLSVDGESWVTGGSVELFRTGPLISPGGTISRTLWVRNGASVSATHGLTGTWHPRDPSNPADVAFAGALELAIGEGVRGATGRLGPGDAVRVAVGAVLPASADNASIGGAATLTVTATLTEIAPAAAVPPETLGVTGALGPGLAGAFGALAIIVGLALVIAARRRGGGVRPRP